MPAGDTSEIFETLGTGATINCLTHTFEFGFHLFRFHGDKIAEFSPKSRGKLLFNQISIFFARINPERNTVSAHEDISLTDSEEPSRHDFVTSLNLLVLNVVIGKEDRILQTFAFKDDVFSVHNYQKKDQTTPTTIATTNKRFKQNSILAFIVDRLAEVWMKVKPYFIEK